MTKGWWMMATGTWIVAEDTLKCGCLMIGYLNEDDTTCVDMQFCPKHRAAPEMYEATRKAEQLASIATDWNLTEAEIDGEMVSVYELRQWFQSVLALADGGR
jgi:hypothetical protein